MQLAANTVIRHSPRTPPVTPVRILQGDKGDPGAPGGSDAAQAAWVNDPASATRAALSATIAAEAVPKWKPNTAYAAGARVVNPSGDIVLAKVAFTSGATYDPANWSLPTTTATTVDDRTGVQLNAARKRAWDSAWTPPPAQDRPTIQVLPTASAIIRPTGARVDFARQGGVASAAADLAGDTHFLVDGTPSLQPVTADPTNFVSSPLLTGGSAQAAPYAFSVTTVTQAANSAIEFQFRAAATAHSFRVYVNGRPVTVAASRGTGLAAGSWYVVNLTFPVAAARTIRIVWGEGGNGGFGAGPVYVPAGQTLARPTFTPASRLAILGDSYEGGAGAVWPAGYSRIESGGYLASQIIGYDSVWQFGIGGTGFIASPSSNAYSTRVSDILAASPTDVIVSGSINDAGQTGSAITAAVTSLLNSLSSVTNVYVLGIQHPTVASYSGLNAAIKAGADAVGRPFSDSLTGVTGPWTTASMLLGDNAHLNSTGQMRRASRIAEALLALKVP